jgi:hypothetical protein
MWTRWIAKGSSVLLLLMIASNALATLDQQLGFWAKISKTGHFSETAPFGYQLIAENRTFNNDSADNLFNIGGYLNYDMTSKQLLALGYQLFHSYDDPTVGGRNENRISQQWLLRIPIGQNTLRLQSILQERQREDMSQWNYRIREKLEFYLPINHWRLETYDELFFNLNTPEWVADVIFSENRAFLGMNYPLNADADFKIGYLNRYVVGNNNNDRMQHILAIELNFS